MVPSLYVNLENPYPLNYLLKVFDQSKGNFFVWIMPMDQGNGCIWDSFDKLCQLFLLQKWGSEIWTLCDYVLLPGMIGLGLNHHLKLWYHLCRFNDLGGPLSRKEVCNLKGWITPQQYAYNFWAFAEDDQQCISWWDHQLITYINWLLFLFARLFFMSYSVGPLIWQEHRNLQYRSSCLFK